MENVLPPAEELRLLDGELAQLEARRAQLMARRAWLVQTLRALQPSGPGVAGPAGPARPWGAAWPSRPAPETSPPSAQNVLLTLGGILLTIAAVAFTLVSWGHMGIGGRSLVLGAVTVAALATPVLLLRRGLTSTAESVAALGLVLMVLDAYALHRVALPDTDAVGYTAVASGVLAGLWTAYGTAVGKLRIPVPVAVVSVQLSLPLWALAADASASAIAWATLATALTDVVIAVVSKPAAVRGLAVAGAAATGGWTLLTGLWLSVTADTPAAAAGPAMLLLAAAGLALGAAWRAPSAAPVTAAAGGLAAVAAVGGVLRTTVSLDWAVPGYLLCAVTLLAVVRTRAPRGILTGLAVASGLVHAAATLWALPLVASALLRPVGMLGGVWSGAPEAGTPLPGMSTSPMVLTVVAAVLWSAPRTFPALTLPRTAMNCTALALAWCAAFAAPMALALPYAATLAVQLVVATAALAIAVLAPRTAPEPAPGSAPPATGSDSGADSETDRGQEAPGTASGPLVGASTAFAVTALVCGLAAGLGVALLGLATRPATFAVLGVLAVASAAASVAGRGATRTVSACVTVVWSTGLVGATAAAVGLPSGRAGLALLAVPAATALLGARLRRHPVVLPVELTGAAAGLVAIALAVPDAPTLALVLALAGVVAAGTAVRPERRPVAGYAAAALFVLASWVRLAASDVSVPEAYTLPVTVPALAVGLLRRRRDPEASSWVAYGPGLAATLVPSLFAAWDDAHWLRPLLLGVAALVITLAGARLRLQALLVLGGAALALDALHELAPYVVQVVGALPRWLPPALAGLLLLAVGATYEQRLRDARRLREIVNRMR
ncbi:SCO7613 C-terminal domain-containing membrane protein [Streptomyces sp. NPDC057445]|uniref:SCO7613 C-terminal domain-containing membrane protein n=1 Tax=Streptomyces sp. NPDC057445 TaxID=3346136 RepID=UPI003680CFD4